MGGTASNILVVSVIGRTASGGYWVVPCVRVQRSRQEFHGSTAEPWLADAHPTTCWSRDLAPVEQSYTTSQKIFRYPPSWLGHQHLHDLSFREPPHLQRPPWLWPCPGRCWARYQWGYQRSWGWTFSDICIFPPFFVDIIIACFIYLYISCSSVLLRLANNKVTGIIKVSKSIGVSIERDRLR